MVGRKKIFLMFLQVVKIIHKNLENSHGVVSNCNFDKIRIANFLCTL